MENYFEFIIWEKAQFAEKRIIKDIKKSFEIIRDFKVSFETDIFPSFLRAFYGHKISDVNSKIAHCGSGDIHVLLIRDPNPKYEKRETSAGTEEVNINMFDKKSLYRTWIGGGHRIHCANSTDEFLHDITILLGNKWDKILRLSDMQLSKEEKLCYKWNLPDFSDGSILKYVDNFGSNISINYDGVTLVFIKNKIDLLLFLNYEYNPVLFKMNKVKIKNDSSILFLFGEDEGEIPKGFVDTLSNDLQLLNLFPKTEFLNTIIPTINLKSYSVIMEKYAKSLGLDFVYSPKDSMLHYKKASKIQHFKDSLKLILFKILYRMKKYE